MKETVTTACTCGIRWTVPYTTDGLGDLSLSVETHTAANPTHSVAVEVEHLGDDH